MIEYFIALFIILVTATVYKFIIQPKKLQKMYVRCFEDQGYRVLEIPFKPFDAPVFNQIIKDEKGGDAYKSLKDLYSQYDVVVSNVFGKIMVDVIHPDFMKDFYFKENHYDFPKSSSIFDPMTRTIYGGGITFREEHDWAQKRKIFNRVFNFDLVRGFRPLICTVCDNTLKESEEKGVRIDDKTVEYNLHPQMVQNFANIVAECLLGGAANQVLDGESFCHFLDRNIYVAFNQGHELLTMIFGVPYLKTNLTQKNRFINRRLQILAQWDREYVKNKLRQTREKLINEKQRRAPNDVLEAIVMDQLYKKEGEQHLTLGEDDIMGEFISFYAAATETTGNFMTMMIYFILSNPEIQTKLRQEIDQHLGDDDYSYENMKKFKYIDLLQKQSMRMAGPTNWAFLREPIRNTQLNGISIKKGTLVGLNSVAAHFSDKYFKKPYEFRPQRWAGQCEDLPAYVLGGFGGGSRSCIGKQMAYFMSKICLIKFFKRYPWVKLIDKNAKMVQLLNYKPAKMTIQVPAKA